jgi:mRNA interferase RelE/StbE
VARFEIEFKKSVEKDVRGFPASDLRKILLKINSLREDPRPPGSVKLAGAEYYRMSQGNYRIVYEILDARLVVVVIKIGHRREVYR